MSWPNIYMHPRARFGGIAGAARNFMVQDPEVRAKFREGYMEALPIADGWADVVISNGVINLSPVKPRVFDELFRVLRPGGRLQVGDITVAKAIPEGAKRNIDLWTN